MKVVKIYLPHEKDAFLKEIGTHISLNELVSSEHKKRLVLFEKFQGAYPGMPPLVINGEAFEFYSYIVFPYKKYGDIVDFYTKA